MDARMTKPEIPNIDEVVAIDIHTHAEEPCGMHGDDGYDDFQAQMAEYFKSPNKHPPTVSGNRGLLSRQENCRGDFFRSTPSVRPDSAATTITRCWKSPPKNSDVLIPFVSIDPHKGKLGVREARKLIEEYGRQGIQIPSDHAGLFSQRPHGLPVVRGHQ